MQKSSAQLMLMVLVVGLLLVRESRQNPGAKFESGYVDWLAANTVRGGQPAPLAVVEINDSSISEKHPWPWSPLDFTLFLQAVLHFNPSVIAMEPVLAWDEKSLPPQDRLKRSQYEKILHDYLLRSPKILMSAQLGFPEDPDVLPPMQPVPALRNIRGSRKAIPEFTVVEREPKEELRLAATLGFTNLPPGESMVRAVPLILSYRGEIVPSFVLQAVMLWYQLTPDDIKIELGSRIVLGNKVTIPIDEAGNMRVDFKSPYNHFGFDDLLLAVELSQAKRPAQISAGAVKNKIALLARVDKGSRTLNLPTLHRGSPGEVIAAAIATIQNQTFIRRVSFAFDGALLIALIVASWFFTRWTRGGVVTFSALLLIVYIIASIIVFGYTLVWLPILMPAGVLVFLVLFRCATPFKAARQES